MKLIKFLFSRVAIFGIILFVQAIWFLYLIFHFGEYSAIATGVLTFLSIFVVLWIIYQDGNPAYKLAWVVPILLFPLFGGLLYVAMGNKKPPKKYIIGLEKLVKQPGMKLQQQPELVEEIEMKDAHVAGQIKYLIHKAGYPVYRNTKTTYYPIGEAYYEALIEDLKQAKHYIFMEYFIVEEGTMFNGILQILEQKVKEGLDVRFMYDDVGSVSMLPFNYYKRLEKAGIKAIAFNPFVPFISMAMNNRDHRKITVIDGHTAYTGGINLADEYINVKKKYGHWKDTGIRLQGDGVYNFTVMFLRMWNINRPTDQDFIKYGPDFYLSERCDQKELSQQKGYVLPYGDMPMDSEITGENVYLNLINSATKYVYIFTPYLIIDHEMMTALSLASKRGVSVKIITPGIPDKKTVFALTRSYYLALLEAGVEIYEYTPGFLHAKCVVSDDKIATVGTINFDYRSLYLHFECGVLLYETDSVLDIKRDFIETMEKSHKVTEQESRKGKPFTLFRAVLRLFAPLM